MRIKTGIKDEEEIEETITAITKPSKNLKNKFKEAEVRKYFIYHGNTSLFLYVTKVCN